MVVALYVEMKTSMVYLHRNADKSHELQNGRLGIPALRGQPWLKVLRPQGLLAKYPL